MAIMAAATATREVALPRRGDAMTPCDGDEARVYVADKAGAGATAAQLACTWAVPWGKEERAVWHPGGGGHSGDGDDNSNNGGSSDSDARLRCRGGAMR